MYLSEKSATPQRSLNQVALRRSPLPVSAGFLRPPSALSAFGALRLSLRAPRSVHCTLSLLVHCTPLCSVHRTPSSLVHCTPLCSVHCTSPSLSPGALHHALSGALHPSSRLGALHFLPRFVHCTPRLLFGALHLPSFGAVHLPPSLGALHHRLLSDALRQLLCLLLGISSNGCPLLVVFLPLSALD